LLGFHARFKFTNMVAVNNRLFLCATLSYLVAVMSGFWSVCGGAASPPGNVPLATYHAAPLVIAPDFAVALEDSIKENGNSKDALADILQVEVFKSFLASPPVLANVVFSERLPPDAKNPSRIDIPLTTSQTFRYWHGRWQPGAFFLRELPPRQPVSDLKTPGTFSASFNGQCWFHYGHGVGNGFVDFGADAETRVWHTAYLNTGQLRQVMMLGLMRSEPGSIDWRGDHFQSNPAKGELRARGDLIRSPDRLVDSLHVIYNEAKGDINWLVRYSKESTTNSKARLIIRCFWLDEGQEIQRDEFAIYALQTQSASLPIKSFHPEGIESLNQWQVHIFTNNAIYAVLPNGQLWLLDKSAPPAPPYRLPGRPSSGERWFVYSIGGGMNLSIFILAVRMIRKNRQTQT